MVHLCFYAIYTVEQTTGDGSIHLKALICTDKLIWYPTQKCHHYNTSSLAIIQRRDVKGTHSTFTMHNAKGVLFTYRTLKSNYQNSSSKSLCNAICFSLWWKRSPIAIRRNLKQKIIYTCTSTMVRNQWWALCTKISKVNLSAFIYRLFHEDLSQSSE